jgi:hypothetical protein
MHAPYLPTRFDDAGDVAAEREVSKADPTEIELPEKRASAAALVAPVAVTNPPLGRLLVGGHIDGLGHG